MTLILFLTCLLLGLLIGEGWLLLQILSQQRRLLLRVEAMEAGFTPQEGVAVPIELEVGTWAPAATAPVQQNGQRAMGCPEPSVLAIGDAAPDFSLPDLTGSLVKLSDFLGRRALVLFWRPSCSFCQRMLDDLKAWEERRPEEALALVVVSSESVADNRAIGLRSPVVLDHTAMSVGNQFGVTGTPMAILVDEEGKIASELAAGAPAVLALARSLQESASVGV